MDSFIVYSQDGKTERCILNQLEYNGEFMGACSVTFSISSPTPIEFQIGDYLIYREERFELNYIPTELKKSSKGTNGESFNYQDVQFNSLSDELVRCSFLDYVVGDNLIHYSSLPIFSFYAESINALAERIQVNLDRIYKGGKKWTVTVHPEYVNVSNKNITVDNISVWDALALANSEFKANFTIKGRTITIGTAGIAIGKLFSYGKGNGLYSIQKTAEEDQGIITRLRAYGSTRNMPNRYYNKLSGSSPSNYLPNNMAVENLMLPDFPKTTLDPYIDSPNISTLGIREGSVYFDGSGDLEEIYPSMEGITADQLRAAGISISLDEGDNGNLDEVADAEQLTDDGTMDDIEEGENIPAFTITLKDIGFDINDYLTSEAATISMKSGMCGGREFEIAQCEKVGNKYVLTCNRSYDESLKLYFPYKGYNISPGDEFVLLNIDMPDVYIQAASQRLLTAAKDYLAKNDFVRYSYEPKVDDIFMARQHEEATSKGEKSIHDTLKEGDLMLFEDTDLSINGSVIIQSLTINEGKSSIPSYEIILRNDKTVGTLEKIQNQIDSLSSGQGRGGLTTQQVESIIRAFGSKIFLSKTTHDRTPFKLEVGDKLTAEKGLQISKNFVSGIVGGSGGYIYLDENGKVVIETDKAVYREEIITPKITFNCIDIISGDKANTFSYGTIKTVDTENRIATLDLLEGQYGTLHVSDICRGVFHNIGGGNTDKDTIGANGFIEYSGFATSYFTPTNILENEAGSMKFEYELQVGTSVHPMPGMNFFGYGNFTDEDRQAITYENRYYTRRLAHVNTWVIDPEVNVMMQTGDLSGLSIGGMDFSGYSFYGKNVYISGTIERLKPNGTPAKDLSYEGVWESGRKYDYYDSVTHDGSTWACMNKDGSSAEPGTNNDWQKIASKGDKGDKGDPGESAVFADLTNQMDNVTLTNDGKVYQDTSISTVAWMSYGSKKMTLTGITCTLPANVTETHDVSTGEITFSVKQGVALDGRNPIPVALTATYNGKAYTGQLTFTLAGVKGGADAVLYRLVPSVSAVIKDANGNLNVTSVSCTRLKSSVSGGTAETGMGDLKYSLDGASEVSIGNNAGVPVSSFQKSIKFIFYVDGTVVDVETIPLVVDGKDGAQGPQGVPGPAGADGKTLYTWIKYADNAQGGGISNNPTGKAYIGFAYNKETATESNNPSDYTWSDIKGEDGIPGATGADGKTYYTWVAYSDNADGTGMYQQPKDTTKYIGIAVNKETATESNNPSDYTWSKFKGEDGQSVSSLGRWHTGLFVPKLSIVTMGGSSFCSKKDTSNPPLWTTTTSDGRRILQTQDGGKTYGYILSGEMNTEEYDLLVQSGKDGSDGTDYEKVFIHTTEENRPSTPATSQTDDYIPSGWHDDPIGVSESLPFEWISERKKRNGIWSNFSTPALWAKYGFDGIDGAEGVAGTSIVWKGDFSSAPSSPQNGWAYKNTTDKKSYVYQDGQWYQMTIDGIDGKNGKDGLSIVWKGDLQSPPSNPQINWAYRDTNNGRVYIWNGTAWSLMVVDGSDGADGAAGSNGLSVFITYNDSTSQPSVPTGNGTTGGWHTNATSGAIWMSQKVASSASDGTWGTPIKIKGDKGDSITYMGRWHTGLIVPKQRVVTMGGSSYIAKKETTNPPLWTVTTSDGRRITQTQDGGKTYGYILSGEMNSAEYDLLASKGEDGKPGADGKPGEKGEQGIQGCIIRHSEWAVGVTYRNDEALTSGTRYLDIAMIRNNAAIDGWDVYKCNTTHTSSESNKPGVSSSTWTKLSGVGPIYTSLIIAKNGSIDFFQGNQFLIKNSANKPVLGMTGGDHEGYITDVRFWVDEEKGLYPDSAKFRVYKSGRVVATDVDLTGTINAISGTFRNVSSPNGSFKIKENGDVELVGKISTSLNGTRIELDPSSNSIKMYNQDNNEVGNISFITESIGGVTNYYPRLMLRRYSGSKEVGRLDISGTSVNGYSTVGTDTLNFTLGPIGLVFSVNGQVTNSYPNR